MKKSILGLIAVFFISAAGLYSQDLDEILDNYFEVMGQQKIIDAKSSTTKGKMVQMGLEIPFNQYSKHPDKFRVEATFQDMTLIQTYNGEEGWNLNPFGGMTEPQAMGEDEMKAMKVQADYEGMLWNWEEKGYKVSLEENEEVEGSDCYVVKTISPEGDEYSTYLDVDSFVALKVKSKVMLRGQEVESETYMSNYQEGDGYVYAGKIETRMNGQVASTIVIDEMTLGSEMDDSIFEKPVK